MSTIDTHGNIHDRSGLFAGHTGSTPSGLSPETVRAAQDTMMGPALAVARSFRIDQDAAQDIVQDAWLDLLKRNRDLEDLVKDPKLLKLVSRTIANRDYSVGAEHGLRHEDFQGRRELTIVEAEFERTNGRTMTPDERKAAATAVRMSFPAGSRPKPDFYVYYQTTSLDMPAHGDDSDGISLGETLNSDQFTEVSSFDDQEDAAGQALHEYENGDAGSKVDVRRDVWRIMSIRNSAPQIARSSISLHSATKHRKFLEGSAGVHRLAQKWMDGLTTEEEDATLFAPFGSLSVEEKERAAEVFDAHPEHAESLWREALKLASRR